MKEQRTNRTLYKDDKWSVILNQTGIILATFKDEFKMPDDIEASIEEESRIEKAIKKSADRALKHLCERFITEVNFNLLSTTKNRQSDNLFFTLRFYCPLGKNDVVDLCISVRDATLQVLNADGFIEK